MKRMIVAPVEELAICASAGASAERLLSTKALHDPMRRFMRCPHVAHLLAAGRTLRLETNSPKLLDHMVSLFAGSSEAPKESPGFLWRIVVEPDSMDTPPWPRRSTFSVEGTRFAQFGQRNFLAVDLDAREAIGFVSEGLFEDAHGFTSPFVDTLFYMTAGALGLVPFAAACVCSATNALLVLGGPDQGKTTACYLAAQDGLIFHADQSVFLEIVNKEIRAWGDFVPLAFRPETLRHLPELASRTHPFSYCDFTFYYLPKQPTTAHRLGHVTPVCCVVLERGISCVPRLDSIAASELPGFLSEHIAFDDDRQYEEQQQQSLAALERLPAYRLAYDSNPASAAPFLRTLLSKHGRSNLSKNDERSES